MSACPERSVWQRFSLGKLEDAELQPLITHLSTCSICCETAEDSRTDDPLVVALRDGADRIPRDAEAGTQQLMERLQLLAMLPILEDEDSTNPQPEITIMQEYRSLLSPPQLPDELGRLGERYRLLKVLGQGGMSVVFLADDLQLSRRVSLKIVKPSLANSLKANERFLFESRAVARLDYTRAFNSDVTQQADGPMSFSPMSFSPMSFSPMSFSPMSSSPMSSMSWQWHQPHP